MSETETIDDQLNDIRIALQARHIELSTLIQFAHYSIPPTLRRKYATALGNISDAIRLLGEKE